MLSIELLLLYSVHFGVLGTGEMALGLRALVALPENIGLIVNT